jgi:hypothetical protein
VYDPKMVETRTLFPYLKKDIDIDLDIDTDIDIDTDTDIDVFWTEFCCLAYVGCDLHQISYFISYKLFYRRVP